MPICPPMTNGLPSVTPTMSFGWEARGANEDAPAAPVGRVGLGGSLHPAIEQRPAGFPASPVRCHGEGVGWFHTAVRMSPPRRAMTSWTGSSK